jgi:hypothetical protein
MHMSMCPPPDACMGVSCSGDASPKLKPVCSPGSDTRYLADGRMLPPMGYGQHGGLGGEGGSTISRVQPLGDGAHGGGARALGAPEAHPLSSLTPFSGLNSAMLENLGPFMSQLMSMGGLQVF